jgi:DNA-binding NarL/FixJ family response regulator
MEPGPDMPLAVPQINLAIVNDYEIVVAGVHAMLSGHPEVRLVQLDARALETGSVDVVLYDNFGQRWHDDRHLKDLIEHSRAKVVVFTWTFELTSISNALAAGASGYLSKGLSTTEIVTAIQAIHRGEVVTSAGHERTAARDRAKGEWPGQEHGLSPRESEILALITQGLSNDDIAAAAYLSINSVKSIIRTAYKKIGVKTRSQAVRYGMQHGFEPHRTSAVMEGPSPSVAGLHRA